MVIVNFANAEALTNAMAALPLADRMRCIAAAKSGGSYEVEAPEELEATLRASHPPAPAPAVITTKADLFRRCTDEEAEAIETTLMGLSVRKRRIFEGAQHIASDDPDFDDLRTAAVEMFGEERAAELLAAS